MHAPSSPADRDTGYVLLRDATNSQIVLSFRGSRSELNQQNALSAALFRPTAGDLCTGCAISVALFETWLFIRAEIRTQVRLALQQNDRFRLVITGHSLGGALATIAGADLRNNLRLTADIVS